MLSHLYGFPRRNWHRFDVVSMVAATSSGQSLSQLWMVSIQFDVMTRD